MVTPRLGVASSTRGALWTLPLLVPVLAAALYVRLSDPLSSPVIAAEDPYTHIVFVKEWLANGRFGDSVALGVGMYPPGFHALVGALAAGAGIDHETLLRFIAPVLGAFSVAGVFFLARDQAGPVAGVVAAVLMAATPEHIFRSGLGAPTALDLALLPWFLLAIVRLGRDGPAWAPVAAVTGAALVLAHPWIMVVAALAAGFYVVVSAVAAEPRPTLLSTALGAVVAAGLFFMSYSYKLADDADRQRWVGDGVGDAGPLAFATHAFAALPPWFVLAIPLALAVAFLVPAWLARTGRGTASATAGVVGGLVLAGGITVGVAGIEHFPMFVDFEMMFGWTLVALAVVGIATVPATRGHAGIAALGFGLATLPFTVVDVFDVWYLPHRTAVYLGLAMAILGGLGVGSVVETLLARLRDRPIAGAGRAVTAVVAASLLAVSLVPVAQGTPAWYRYYEDEQYEGIREAASLANDDRLVVIVTGSWQSNLFFKALVERMGEQVHYRPEVYKDRASSESFFKDMRGRDVYVWWDLHTFNATKNNHPWFLDQGAVRWSSADGQTKLVRVEGLA
ncbi:MAG TPA: glycosyltransferase family 39 protein [Candidatus Thermoplasmatota archaeon]|nr:glycosyltransferase family 39 protein [Candidatus Thermoplasmatota archaeon]